MAINIVFRYLAASINDNSCQNLQWSQPNIILLLPYTHVMLYARCAPHVLLETFAVTLIALWFLQCETMLKKLQPMNRLSIIFFPLMFFSCRTCLIQLFLWCFHQLPSSLRKQICHNTYYKLAPLTNICCFKQIDSSYLREKS